jgi:hypothetical protein
MPLLHSKGAAGQLTSAHRVTNSFLALPQFDTQQLIAMGINYEKDAFGTSPDKVSYCG